MIKKLIVPYVDQDPPAWDEIAAAYIEQVMGDQPTFMPHTELRLAYNTDVIFGQFKVSDKHILSKTTQINGPVSDDSCVEFFFAPNDAEPTHYFNLEINAGGTALMFFIKHPWTDYRSMDPEDIKQIDIVHSLPAVIESEIPEETEWSIEFQIPILVLRKYSEISEPKPGVSWRANFYKTATNTSNPHYLSWNRVEFEKPNFHLPEFFGEVVFK